MKNEIKDANKKLSVMGLAVIPTNGGIMCIVKDCNINLNCPPILDRINCSPMASTSTIVQTVKNRIKNWN